MRVNGFIKHFNNFIQFSVTKHVKPTIINHKSSATHKTEFTLIQKILSVISLL